MKFESILNISHLDNNIHGIIKQMKCIKRLEFIYRKKWNIPSLWQLLASHKFLVMASEISTSALNFVEHLMNIVPNPEEMLTNSSNLHMFFM